jgi:hypothetical protein
MSYLYDPFNSDWVSIDAFGRPHTWPVRRQRTRVFGSPIPDVVPSLQQMAQRYWARNAYLVQAKQLREEGKLSILAGMSQDAILVINEAEAAGWHCYRSNNNHVICRAPDGKTTFAVARTLYGGIARKKLRDLKKWKDKHPQEEAVSEDIAQSSGTPEPTVESEVEIPSRKDGEIRMKQQRLSNGATRLVCAKCGWIGQTARSVAQHYLAAHTDRSMRAAATRRQNKSKVNGTMAAIPSLPESTAKILPAQTRSLPDSDALLNQVRSLLRVVPDSEITQLRAENAALRKEVEVMRSERQALRDLLSNS